MHALNDLDPLILLCNFDSGDAHGGRAHVGAMGIVVQTRAVGVGVLEYNNADERLAGSSALLVMHPC
jgi:hypothetical protein